MIKNYSRLYKHYKNIALNRYRWENLPDGISSKNIEKFLFETGQVFFTNDKNYGFICLPCSSAGMQNVYGEPLRFVLTGVGFSKTYDRNSGIWILDNDAMLSMRQNVEYYAYKINAIEKTMAQNLRQQKFPYIMLTTEENRLSANIMSDQIANGKDVIFVDKDFAKNGELGIQTLPTLAPYLLDKLQQAKIFYEKELLQILGIDCTIEKRERLLVDEINSNNEEILTNLDLGFKYREEACKLINEKYGLNVRVYKVIEELNKREIAITENKEEEKNNGEIHDRN